MENRGLTIEMEYAVSQYISTYGLQCFLTAVADLLEKHGTADDLFFTQNIYYTEGCENKAITALYVLANSAPIVDVSPE